MVDKYDTPVPLFADPAGLSASGRFVRSFNEHHGDAVSRAPIERLNGHSVDHGVTSDIPWYVAETAQPIHAAGA